MCGADRENGGIGFCGASDKIKTARAALHFWEEPCISGDGSDRSRGSGTVFFSGCNLKCVYCQNAPISRGAAGAYIDILRLAEIMLELQDSGAYNINLVTPTHYVSQIRSAIDISREGGLKIPIVYNTSGYERPEIIESLKGYADIFLTDYKYSNNEDALRYSGVGDYVEYADAALSRMVRLAPLSFDSDGIMQSGVIVRHLMLPGKLTEAKNILKRIFTLYGNSIYYSIMSQYVPPGKENIQPDFPPELMKKVSAREYSKLIDYADRIGITNAYIQDGESASESFIPPFDLEGVFRRCIR